MTVSPNMPSDRVPRNGKNVCAGTNRAPYVCQSKGVSGHHQIVFVKS